MESVTIGHVKLTHLGRDVSADEDTGQLQTRDTYALIVDPEEENNHYVRIVLEHPEVLGKHEKVAEAIFYSDGEAEVLR